MSCGSSLSSLRTSLRIIMRILAIVSICWLASVSFTSAQTTKQVVPNKRSSSDPGDDHVQQRNEWFFRGRLVHGKNAAELRRRAWQTKLKLRAQHAAAARENASSRRIAPASLSSGSWVPLGPVPLASDASGTGTQDYRQVSGRATAVAIDPADPSGNTLYIAGAQSGVWKSTNAANGTANNVTWTPTTDDQATLSIGAIAIQPGNTNPTESVILAATGEADNSTDSYFGLGILRSADAGNTWTLISSANNNALSFSGLGGTRMAFDTASAQIDTVVAAMATTSEGVIAGAVNTGTMPGLYTSLNAGQTWSYNALVDPGGAATDAASATSVVFNASANSGNGQFFAAVRYHGFYSSPDGLTWTRLASQPSGSTLSTTACPPISTSNNYACPIYRAEMTVVPGRNEMYAWLISLSSTGIPVDGGIWQSLDGGNTWNTISDAAITNCGDFDGCGVQQGAYNLELLALPNGSGTDLYAGAINLYKCQITSQNPACTGSSFLNLTHVYGCDPIAAPAHVHPAQHALAYAIPASGNALMYFANDGGIYRALDGFFGLSTGSCSGTNLFDDLNQNLGSMTQFIGFSQHPTDQNTLLGGAQDNGSPATGQATTNPGWGNVLGGDGGYNAIDPNTPTNFYASNPDLPPGGLGVQLCSNGVACDNSGFDFVVTSSTVGGDDGAFYFPYILDPASSSAMLVGTCRVWRGPRTGGPFTVLSPNFETLGSATCTGSEINQISSLATGGVPDDNGSSVIYATTSGLGPIAGVLTTPAGGHVWVTRYATGGVPAFYDVTNNGPQGSINPNQFPISGVALDPTDTTGQTAYVTVMGFTGSTGHVWRTTDAGATWFDYTGNLPDVPANAVVVSAEMAQVFVATDVGVFAASTSLPPAWVELGPDPTTGQAGFLPNAAVTAIGIFTGGGQQLLRASTYGRGVWEFNLVITPDFQISVSTSPLVVFPGQTATWNGTASELSGYASSVTLSCVAGSTAPPAACSAVPATLTPADKTPFTLTASDVVGNYNFNLQAVGSDPDNITHLVPLTLQIVNLAMSSPSPATVTVPRGTTSIPVSFQITAAGSFNQSVNVSCSGLPGATCTLTPSTTVNPTAGNPANMTASVGVPVTTAPGTYTVTIQATTAGAETPLTASFTVVVTTNPDFILQPFTLPEVNVGSAGASATLSISSQDGFSNIVTLSCSISIHAGNCSISPNSVSSYPATATVTVNAASLIAGSYTLTVTGSAGSDVHSLAVPLNVGDYSISGTQTLSLVPGGQGTASLKLIASTFYSGAVNATCDISALPGAQCLLTPANPLTLATGGSANLTATLNVTNDAAAGTYNININTQDTTGAPSHSFTIALTVAQDFIVFSSTASQTVTAGQTSGPYSLTIQPVGTSFSGAVTLACTSGLPAGAQCLFSPSGPQTPGSSAVDVVMSISTAARKAQLQSSSSQSSSNRSSSTHRTMLYALWSLLPVIVIGCGAGGSRHATPRLLGLITILILTTLALLSCSGVSTGGGGGTCSSAPTVPSGLAPSATTSSGTTLSWTASSATAGCAITYSIFQDQSAIANATSLSYTVTGLQPSTLYNFQVSAMDSFGVSAPTGAVSVTTLASGNGGQTYPITVTGSSPGTAPDAGQSLQVLLIVD